MVLICSLVVNAALFLFIGYKLYLRYSDQGVGHTNTIGSPYWQDKVDYFEILNEQSSGQVFFVGDSMFDRLHLESFFSDKAIQNRAIGYENTVSLIHRLENTVINGYPVKIVLYIGGNDISKNDDIDSIINRAEEIIEIMLRNNIEVNVVSILPRGREYKSSGRSIDDINSDTRYFNSQVMKQCQKLKCSFIDITDLFVKENYLDPHYTSDNIHLNAQGTLLLSQVLKPYVINESRDHL